MMTGFKGLHKSVINSTHDAQIVMAQLELNALHFK